jgi:hypothetical protein
VLAIRSFFLILLEFVPFSQRRGSREALLEKSRQQAIGIGSRIPETERPFHIFILTMHMNFLSLVE